MKVSALLLVSLFCPGDNSRPGSPDSSIFSAFAPFPPPICPSSGVLTLPHQNRCDAYYECVEGESSFKECPEGQLYKHEEGALDDPCGLPLNVQCPVSTPAPLPPVPECREESRHHLPGDDTCNYYYECRGGVATYRACPVGLLYNVYSPASRFPCDYPENVDCSSLRTPPPPPPVNPVSPSLEPPRGPERDEPKKVFNFYTHVTHHW